MPNKDKGDGGSLLDVDGLVPPALGVGFGALGVCCGWDCAFRGLGFDEPFLFK